MRKSTASLLLAPALLVVLLLLGLPLLYLLSFSLFESSDGPFLSGAFTLHHYADVLTDTFYLQIFGNTLWLAALTTAVSAVLGYCLAHFIWRRKRWHGLFVVLMLSPLVVSIVVSSYGWMVMLGNNGIINNALSVLGLIKSPLKLIYTDAAIVIGLVHLTLPFMVLSILAALERIDATLPEAAATLGASPARVLWNVTLPLARPGFAAGTTIVFCLSLSAYVTPSVLGPSGPNFITTLIYSEFVTQLRWPVGAALASILLVISLAVVLLYIRLIARLDKVHAAGVST
jgi:putative spermidine/putrescine transport system permease protein